MRLSRIFSILFLLAIFITGGRVSGQGFDRPVFYAAMSSDKLDEINGQLNIIKGSSFTDKTAYEGALLMKKAGLVNGAKEKLSLFKSGRSKLESAIAKDGNNTEYRFLRLIIQEHAPKIVKYRNELEEDSKFIKTNFRGLPLYLQQAITDYSKSSKVLKSG